MTDIRRRSLATRPTTAISREIQPGYRAGGVADNRYPQQTPPGQPDQPVNPQIPTLQRRVPLQQAQTAPPPPPFRLRRPSRRRSIRF